MIELIIPTTHSDYSLTRSGDKVIIRKLNEFVDIVVSFYKRSSCDTGEFSEIYLNEIMGEEQFVVRLPIEDGLYKIEVITSEYTDSYVFPVFETLLSSLVNNIEEYFCDNCGCQQGCEERGDKRLEILTKLLIFYSLNKQYLGGILDKALGCTECAMYEALNCYLYNETIGGNPKLKELYDKIVGTFYLTFYYSHSIFSDTEDRNKKFKYNKIKDCLILKNIPTECIKNKLDNMATFTIAYSAYVNQPPSVGSYTGTGTHAEEKTLTVAMFTTQTVPAYSGPEADAAQAIRIDSLPTNGAVLTLNGTPIASTGTIVTMADIAAGKLKLKGSTSTTTAHNSAFTFSVRDTGSMTFSS